MVSGYNTITLTSLDLTPEEQRKIVVMYNSNNKPLMARFLLNSVDVSVDLTIILHRLYNSHQGGDGVQVKRGYIGELYPGLNMSISIGPDDSVTINDSST